MGRVRFYSKGPARHGTRKAREHGTTSLIHSPGPPTFWHAYIGEKRRRERDLLRLKQTRRAYEESCARLGIEPAPFRESRERL